MIARLDAETLEENAMFLDAPIFPGNSGGPVICKPTNVHLDKTKAVDKAYLLGLATKYFTEKEIQEAALNEEDLKKLEGHLGLSKIVVVDAIYEAITEFQKRHGKNEQDSTG
jgi:hypothetical protein